jgi:acetyl-CoA synthetase
VAVVGATDRPGAYGAHVLANLRRAGFPGRVVAVNPGRTEVYGYPCLPGLDAIDAPVDAVVVATPAATVPSILAAAGGLGCGGAVVFAAGFSEAGDLAAQDGLVAAAATHALPVLGPNANGLVAVRARAPLWGDAVTLPAQDGGIALITQSGNIGVVALAHRGGLGLHTVVSLGNAAVVDAATALEHLAGVDGVRCVAAYVEADGDGARLATALAICADRDVRVVVLKAGRSAAGRVAGAAHTAALSGDHAAFRALLQDAGAVLVEEPHALLETARAATALRRNPGSLAVMTCSGADATVTADLAQDAGVPLARLEPSTRADLAALLPTTATVANPLDHTNLVWADPPALQAIGAALAADAEVGHVLYVQDQPPGLPASDVQEWTTTRDGALAGLGATGLQPVLVATTPGQEPDGAVGGLRAALTAVALLRRPAPDALRLREIAGAARQVAGREDGDWLPEHEGLRLLAEAGVSVPDHRVIALDPSGEDVPDAACRAARELGGPVVLKLSAPDLVHKTESGAVLLGLADPAAVADGVARLLAVLADLSSPAVLLVEQMVDGDVEVLVSARTAGVVPTLTIGLGGIWAEALADVVTLPLPVRAEQVVAALAGLRGAAVLLGRRDGRVMDVDALATLAARVGAALLDGELTLVECNPVLVGPCGAVAVDAVIRSATRALDEPRTAP